MEPSSQRMVQLTMLEAPVLGTGLPMDRRMRCSFLLLCLFAFAFVPLLNWWVWTAYSELFCAEPLTVFS